jgi:hypothetical protein
MSVTFCCMDAPRKQVPCQFCDEPWADFPEGNGKGGKCDAYCTGFTSESVAPEVNFANGNAIALLRLLGWTDEDDYLSGSCDGATMRQRILKARNGNRDSAVREAYEQKPKHTIVKDERGLLRIERSGPRIISFGNTDEQTLQRLAWLEALAVWAQDNEHEISWG